ncbi:MAG: hypothetical protein VZR12_04975 [Candidatus Cryptobacteroides sp.]|nr:hypothetical protein [Candidatus Cryptobacteroides sp.]
MKVHLFLLSIVIPFVLFSCGRSRMLAHLEDIESYIQERPDSALAVLDSIDRTRLSGRKEKALFSLLNTMALDKNYIDPKEDSLIEPAVKYYSKHGDPDIRLKAFFYKGRISLYNGHYYEAILSYMEGYRYIDKCKDDKYCGLLCDDISRCFINTYNQAEALVYLKKAKEYYEKGNLSVYNFNAAIPLVTIYMNQKEWSKADSVFCSVEGENLPTSIREGIYESRARYYTYAPDHDYALANEFYSELISLGADIQFNSLCSYAYSLEECGRHKESDAILLQAANSINDNQSHKGRYNSVRSNIEGSRGNYKESLHFLKESVFYQIEDIEGRMRISALKAQREFFSADRALKEKEAAKQRYYMAAILLGFVIIMIVGVFVYRRMKARAESEKNRYAEMASVAEKRLAEIEKSMITDVAAESELAGEAESLRERLQDTEGAKASLESILADRESTLSKLRSEYGKIYKEQFIYLGKLCEAYFRAIDAKEPHSFVYAEVRNLIDDLFVDRVGYARFERMVDRGLDGVMSKFRQDFPGLDEGDYRFACYLFVGFDATTLMIILKMVSTAAVYVRKNRLKKMIIQSSSLHKEFYLSMFK